MGWGPCLRDFPLFISFHIFEGGQAVVRTRRHPGVPVGAGPRAQAAAWGAGREGAERSGLASVVLAEFPRRRHFCLLVDLKGSFWDLWVPGVSGFLGSPSLVFRNANSFLPSSAFFRFHLLFFFLKLRRLRRLSAYGEGRGVTCASPFGASGGMVL